MKVHGLTVITKEGCLVRTEVSGPFNEFGIEAHFKEVLKAAEGIEKWVLYKHVSKDAMMTPDALEALIQWYGKLPAHGCRGVYYHMESNMMLSMFREKFKALSIPFLFQRTEERLPAFIKDKLG